MAEAINEIMSGASEYLEEICFYVHEWYLQGTELWTHIPSVLRYAVVLSVFLAALGVVTSLIKAISNNYREWGPMPNGKLMFSYFCGSGDHQRKLIYKNAKSLVTDRTWPWISAAGLAFRLGNFSHSSKLVMFLISFAYIPLAVIGAIELIFRAIIAHISYFFLNFFIAIIYLIIRLIAYILIPIFRVVDGAMRVEQHCPHCYNTFKLPHFKCPYCNEIHQQLVPAKSGLFFARCSCGHFLPCSCISKRNKLSSACPKCNTDLAASNAKQFSIQVIGGNSAGKTAFISAFQHLYQSNIGAGACTVSGEPKDAFSDIEAMFNNGCTEPSPPSEVIPYTLVHQTGATTEQSLIFYDIPDEILLSEEYERNPLNFGYSDGIVVIIDPLSTVSVRNECEKLDPDSVYGSSQDSSESIVIHFITKFSEISGRAARKMSSVPVAVLIAKSDVKGIKNKIGMLKIKSIFRADPEKYQNSMEIATDEVCRQYLADIGLSNILNNLDAVFSMVRCFPISSIGHISKQGLPFEPYGVVEPIAWIGEIGRAGMSTQLKMVRDCVLADGFQERMANQNLVERYTEAEKLYRIGRLEAATKAFADLGSYRDAAERVEQIKELRYKTALKRKSDKDFDGAIEDFRSLGNYKDSAQQTTSSQFAKIDYLVSVQRHKDALDFLATLQKSKVLTEKLSEVRYDYAIFLIQNQDYIAAYYELEQLGRYRDSQEKLASISLGFMQQQIKAGTKNKIKFGKYKWRVLSIHNEMALIITEDVIKSMAYNETLAETCCWSESLIRKYLNTRFLGEFDPAEKSLILTVPVKTPRNPEFGTSGGSDTSDKVFLLSIEEAQKLFSDDSDRKAEQASADVEENWYWLRSMGGEIQFAAIIEKNGKVSTGGNWVTNQHGGVRPAMYIRL